MRVFLSWLLLRSTQYLQGTDRRATFGSSLKRSSKTDQPERSAESAEGQNKGDEVLRIDTGLTVLDFVVTDASGKRYVRGLGKDDFILYEDGNKQEIDSVVLGNNAPQAPSLNHPYPRPEQERKTLS